MAEQIQTEYFLLRYVWNIVHGEFLNIGVIAMRIGADGKRQAEVRFTDDWRRVRAMDPSIDTELFVALQAELQEWLNSDLLDCSRGGELVARREWVLEMLKDCASNAITLSSGNILQTPAGISAELGSVANGLVKEYCGVEDSAFERETAGRTLIRKRMREAFERVGVWKLMNKGIPVSEYTREGDPLKIDCGYEVKRWDPGENVGLLPGTHRVERLFHAVSLSANVDASTVLAYAWPSLRDGYQQLQQSTAVLTAIVEDDLNRNDKTIRSALEFLDRKGVMVGHVKQLPDIAEKARRELTA